MSEQMLTVVATPAAGSIVVLSAIGEIDRDSQSTLAEAAEVALEKGGNRLVIDLTGVSFCDSGGLSLFARLHRQLDDQGGFLRLAGAQPPVRTVLETVNFDRLLAVYPTLDEALR